MKRRIQRLKEKLFAMDDRTVFLERLFLMRKGYEKYKEEPSSLRYALILNEILSNMSIVIDEDDLIVGRIKETIPTPDEDAALENIAKYYYSVCPEAMTSREITVEDWAYLGRKENKEDYLMGAFFSNISSLPWFSTLGHVTVSWETLLNKGMRGVKELAQKTLAEVEGGDMEAMRKKEFLNAVIISCDAVINFAKRYEETLLKIAKEEKNEQRQKELVKIAHICQRVPTQSARSFHEALQSIWFLDLILHTVCGARDYTPGRMDQYLYTFYKDDLEQGILSREDAIELLQNFFIHTVEISGLGDQAHGSQTFGYTTTRSIKRSLCKDSVQYLVLAGQTPDGRDACNELSFLVLDAMDEIRTKTPNIMIRYHKGIDKKFWLQACDLMRRKLNNIGVYNDEVMIPAFTSCGVRPEDAITYSHYGCCNPCIPGKEAQLREDQRNLPKMLELTLNDGFDPIAQIQRGPKTGTIDDFQTFDDLLKAFKIQIQADVARAVENKVQYYKNYLQERPFSFESCLLEDCVEMAMDCNNPKRNPSLGGPGYIHHNIDAGGLATTADSLAAIKKLVYDDKEISLKTLKAALDKNYEGYEMLQLRLQNKCPKFGNDDDYVDSIAQDIALTFCTEVVNYDTKNPILGQCWPQLYSYHRYQSCGLETGATPDGRKAFEPVSENQSPTNGCDVKGLSALINSLSKLHQSFSLTPGGGVTINVHPTALMVEDGARILSDIIETYFEKGGMHLQFNIIDKDTLLEAQKHPEKHRDLVVRVTGYSAYFVTLSPESQDNIISRYAHYS